MIQYPKPIPLVPVLWWNDNTLAVECPFCAGTHEHNLEEGFFEHFSYHKYGEVAQFALCKPGTCVYRLCFPFCKQPDEMTGRIAYEIDKEKRAFVSVFPRVEKEEDLSKGMESLSITGQHTSESRSYSEDHEEQRHCDTESDALRQMEERLEGLMVVRYLLELETIIQTTAVAELRTLSSLQLRALKNGGDTKVISTSSIWVRAQTILYTLGNETSQEKRVREGLQKIGLSEIAQKLEGKASLSACNETFLSARSRSRKYSRMLEAVTAAVPTKDSLFGFSSTATPQPFIGLSFCRPRNSFTINLLKQGEVFEQFPVGSPKKTVGRLERGTPFPPINAMSGYSGLGYYYRAYICRREYTEKVLGLAKMTGYRLPPDGWDPYKRPGVYNACHVEKQLIAYFIDKHVLTPEEIDFPEEESGHVKKVQGCSPNVIGPTASLRKVDILVSKKPCPDCMDFVEHIREYFKLEINVTYQEVEII